MINHFNVKQILKNEMDTSYHIAILSSLQLELFVWVFLFGLFYFILGGVGGGSSGSCFILGGRVKKGHSFKVD